MGGGGERGNERREGTEGIMREGMGGEGRKGMGGGGERGDGRGRGERGWEGEGREGMGGGILLHVHNFAYLSTHLVKLT